MQGLWVCSAEIPIANRASSFRRSPNTSPPPASHESYVIFALHEDAVAAKKKLDNTKLDGRLLKIELAAPRAPEEVRSQAPTIAHFSSCPFRRPHVYIYTFLHHPLGASSAEGGVAA